ncbi:MAG: hypothetical protein V8S98_03780 [Lachnospiraceae bacterium]
MVVGIAFLVFVSALVLKSLKVISIDPNFIGYAMIAIAILTTIVSPKEAMSSLDAQMILFCAGINLMIAVMNQSGLGQVFGDLIIKVIGESRNLFLSDHRSSLYRSFYRNLLYEQHGMRRNAGSSWYLHRQCTGCESTGYRFGNRHRRWMLFSRPITPSGTNQTMLIFTKLKFQDFAKFGWPLLIISWILCIAILPQVFPFF